MLSLIHILYALRNLHLSAAMLARLESAGYEYVLFRVGEAVLLIELAQLERANHIFTLEPILNGAGMQSELERRSGDWRAWVCRNGERLSLIHISNRACRSRTSRRPNLSLKAMAT